MADFKTDDELYAKLLGDEPIHVLVEAYSHWSKKTEPLVFCLEYGKGRVVHNAFGHDGKALATPGGAEDHRPRRRVGRHRQGDGRTT